MNTYFIIQARTGSTRLSNKMIMPFYEDLTIPQVIINKLISNNIQPHNIILATTDSSKDDILAKTISQTGCRLFRGNEENVLKRFIDSAEYYNCDHFFRICADNPFLNYHFITEILKNVDTKIHDYVSFTMSDGTPAIRTHFGFFSEFTTLKTLKKVVSLTSKKIDIEHVTNFIYSNPDQFSLNYIEIPKIIQDNNWLRLTIDTIEDFETAQSIFREIPYSDDYNKIILLAKPFAERMNDAIIKQSK